MLTFKKIFFTIIVTIVPLLFAFFTFSQINSAGFLDGHVTEFQAAAKNPSIVFIILDLLSASFLAYLNIKQTEKKQILKYLIIYFITRLILIYGLNWYLKSYLQLNYGQGG